MLTVRIITPTLRNGEVLTLVAASIIFTVGFYIPLKQMMGALASGMSSYAQYLMPLIALQAIAFAALSAAFRSATDSVLGINRRFDAMPIAPLTPVGLPHVGQHVPLLDRAGGLAGMRSCHRVPVLRRLGAHRGLLRPGAAHWCGAVLAGDLIGAAIENPEATAPLMLLPQLILGFLSVGVQPVEQFPSWIQPFVRNQPASQEVYALRALAGDSTPTAGSVSWSVIGPTLLWVAGVIVVLVPLHVLVASRRR